MSSGYNINQQLAYLFLIVTACYFVTAAADGSLDCPPSSHQAFELAPSYNPESATWTIQVTNWTVSIKENGCNWFYVLFSLRLTSFDNNWTFARGQMERRYWTWVDRHDQESQVNLTVKFDHAYTGDYVLGIRYCPQSSLDGDEADDYLCPEETFNLGRVETSLSGRLDVEKMNISIQILPNEYEGVTVLLSERYHEDIGALKILPFQEFLVELRLGRYEFRAATRWKVMEFRFNPSALPCHDDLSLPTAKRVCYINLPNATYHTSVSVTPIDSRCNVLGLNGDLTPIQATRSSKLAICQRTVRGSEIDIGHSVSTESQVSRYETSSYTGWTIFGAILPVVVIGAILFYLRQRRRKTVHLNGVYRLSRSDLDSLQEERQRRALLIYDADCDHVRENAATLRHQLKANGDAQVFDHGDPSQEEERNVVGIHNWFLQLINDPSVRIVVILSPGLLQLWSQHQRKSYGMMPRDHQQGLLLFLIHQLVALEASRLKTGRIFVVTYENHNEDINETIPLNPFARYQLPEHLDQLLDHMFMTR